MQIIQARGRQVQVVTRKRPSKARLSMKRASDELFKTPVDTAAQIEAIRLVSGAHPKSANGNETEHEKVFRLVREQKFEEAARIAARLINAGNDDGFFIYGDSQEFDSASAWHKRLINEGEPHANVHIISPERAQVLLLNNSNNRTVKAPNLSKIMRDIESGRFELNGESIVVCKDGTVNDGQHRSFAVLLTGSPIETVVAYGVTKASMRTVNIGEKRQAKDRLAIAGVSNSTALSAMAAFAFEVYNERKPTPSEVDDYFHDNRERLVDALCAAGAPVKGAGPSVCGVAALHLLSAGFDPTDINEFFRRIRNGEDMKRGNPALVLHRAFFNSDHKIKLSRENWLRAFVHHFTSWKRGVKLGGVVFNHDIQKVA